MRRFALISIVITLIWGSLSCDAQSKKTQKETTEVSDIIEIYYFHYTRRCITCNAVESVTKEAIAEVYPELVKNGKIKFTSVNLDEDGSKDIAKKCQAEGQSLLFLVKNKRIDLTDKGFMYAKNSPEKLKAEVKNVIDALLK